MCPRPPIQCPSSSWPITVNVGTFVLSVRQQRVHVSPGLARTRLRGRRLQAPPMLQRCACALQAAGHGDSCAGSGRRRSGAPGASITKYTRGSVFIVPFPPLTDGRATAVRRSSAKPPKPDRGRLLASTGTRCSNARDEINPLPLTILSEPSVHDPQLHGELVEWI